MEGKSRAIIAYGVYWCYGVTAFDDYVYWTQSNPIGLFRKKRSGNEPVEMIANGTTIGRYFGIAVVHPRRQPLGKFNPLPTT